MAPGAATVMMGPMAWPGLGGVVADRVETIKGLARRAGRLCIDTLFPETCLACRRHVRGSGAVCAACWSGLRFLERPWCEVLGIPFEHDMGEGFLSAKAIADPPPFDRARAAVAYDGAARDMVQALKFRDRTEFGPWMAQWMMRAGAELIDGADIIAAVPLHRRRFLSRRFNQSAELARSVAQRSGIAFDPAMVVRNRGTRQQIGLGLKDREKNVRGAFQVPAPARARLAGRRVLLVDDVFTTGATVAAVARTLKRSGAAGVDVLTFARVLPEDFRRGSDGTI